jgi:hypothetical protein
MKYIHPTLLRDYQKSSNDSYWLDESANALYDPSRPATNKILKCDLTMSDQFKPLFNRNLLNARVESFIPELTEEQLKVAADWASTVSDPKFRREKERSHQGTFLMQAFGITGDPESGQEEPRVKYLTTLLFIRALSRNRIMWLRPRKSFRLQVL